jgi:uncharacterized membrane protein
MIRISLQILIIIWWLGAATATGALLTHVYGHYLIIGIVGWTTIIATTTLIVYELKKIKEEDKKKSSAEKKIK